MNVKELIEKYEYLNHDCFRRVDTSEVLKDLKQLDEPQPVKVSPSVAVWYEINKDNLDKNIAYLCLNNWGEFINDKTLFNWMSNTDNFIQILVNMHQFGYEVEEEKRYVVKVKGVCGNHETLNCEKHSKKWLFSDREENSLYKTKHTRKELEEAGFGWVFDCPGIQVQEVE